MSDEFKDALKAAAHEIERQVGIVGANRHVDNAEQTTMVVGAVLAGTEKLLTAWEKRILEAIAAEKRNKPWLD